MTTFDLTGAQGAADAAAHLIARFGQPTLITSANGHPFRLRPNGVTVWPNPDSHALMVSGGILPCTFQGVIEINECPEFQSADRRVRRLLAMMREPLAQPDDHDPLTAQIEQAARLIALTAERGPIEAARLVFGEGDTTQPDDQPKDT